MILKILSNFQSTHCRQNDPMYEDIKNFNIFLIANNFHSLVVTSLANLTYVVYFFFYRPSLLFVL